MLNFDIRERIKKENPLDIYDCPVLVMNPKTQEKKGIQKFRFNNKAVKSLNITAGNYVGLAFDDKNNIVIVNLDNTEKMYSAKVNKDFSFNSKKMFNKIIKYLNLDENKENIMKLDCNLDESSLYSYGIINKSDLKYNINETFGIENQKEENIL